MRWNTFLLLIILICGSTHSEADDNDVSSGMDQTFDTDRRKTITAILRRRVGPFCRPGAGRDPRLPWIPAGACPRAGHRPDPWAGMTGRRARAVPSV